MNIALRSTTANAILLFLIIIIAVIQIAPQVDLDPAAQRWEWSVCALWLAVVVVVTSCAGISRLLRLHFQYSFLVRTHPWYQDSGTISPRPGLLRC